MATSHIIWTFGRVARRRVGKPLPALWGAVSLYYHRLTHDLSWPLPGSKQKACCFGSGLRSGDRATVTAFWKAKENPGTGAIFSESAGEASPKTGVGRERSQSRLTAASEVTWCGDRVFANDS